MLITLQELKAHATNHPSKLFPLGSCTDCLAAHMTGLEMDGYQTFAGSDSTVDPTFAEFVAALSDLSWQDERGRVSGDQRMGLTGAQCAAAIDRLIDGVHPHEVAQDTWSNRNVA